MDNINDNTQEEKEQEQKEDREDEKLIRDAEETLHELRTKPTTLAEVYTVFNEWVYLPYPPALKIILATCLSLQLDNPPVWLQLIGPSGSGKTLILRSLESKTNILINAITPKAFVSGLLGKQKDCSTLPLFHMKNIIVPELSTMLTKDPRVLNEVIGELVSIHDEIFGGIFGSGKALETYRTKCGLIMGITTVIDRFYKVQQALGPRTVNLRLPKPNPKELKTFLRKAKLSEKQKRTELRLAATGYLQNFELHPEKITISEEWDAKICALAEFVATARSIVSRDGYTKEINQEPEIESLSRLYQNFTLYAITFCLMENKAGMDEEEYTLIKRIGWDSIPPFRAKLLKALLQDPGGFLTGYRVGVQIDEKETTTSRALGDLVALEICEKTSVMGSECCLSPAFLKLAEQAGLEAPKREP